MRLSQQTFRVASIIIVVAIAAGIGLLWMRHRRLPPIQFRISPAKRGDLVAVIDSTGTAEPEEVADIGAQVLGQIDYFGRDANGKTVDWDSPVEQGTVLAHIDDSLCKAAWQSAVRWQFQARLGGGGDERFLRRPSRGRLVRSASLVATSRRLVRSIDDVQRRSSQRDDSTNG